MALNRQLLIITNGYGEDMMGAMIAEAVKARTPTVNVRAFPLVGPGTAFDRADVPKVHASAPLPSGGYVLRDLSLRPQHWKNVTRDLRSGLIADLVRQRRVMRGLRGQVTRVLAVGDAYPAVLAKLWLGMQADLVQTAKTVLATRFFGPEIAAMRWACRRVLVRDDETAAWLRQRRVSAISVGNPMMDALTYGLVDLPKASGERLVAIFPGSREGIESNLRTILTAIPLVHRRLAELPGEDGRFGGRVQWVIAWPPTQPDKRVRACAAAAGWQVDEETSSPLHLKFAARDGGELGVIFGGVGDLLQMADVAVGVAGTVHEQAGGHGVPVITFPGVVAGRSADRFVRTQKRFLGDGMQIVAPNPESIAAALYSVLTDERLRQEMSVDAKRRIGRPGAVQRITDLICEELKGGGP